jgi:hypothetical protein
VDVSVRRTVAEDGAAATARFGTDAREGVASFLEKRPPHFTMRPSRDLPSFYPWWPERPFR